MAVEAAVGAPRHAAPETHAAHHEHPARRSMNQVGLWLFFVSESFLFAALLSGRFYLAGFSAPEHVDQFLGLVITLILISSSFTAYMSETAMARGDRANFMRFLLATIVLGLAFAVGVGFEWSEAHFGIGEPYGTAFFSMTGLHASHVISGVVMLAIVAYLGARGHFSKDDHWGVEATIKYWHFVDVVWVFFYPALYLANW
jgi:cytochrome c oxidase subunit 3